MTWEAVLCQHFPITFWSFRSELQRKSLLENSLWILATIYDTFMLEQSEQLSSSKMQYNHQVLGVSACQHYIR